MKKIAYVVAYQTAQGTRYTAHATERKAKVWGFRRMAKTGENFKIQPMTWAEALRL